ncbi:uncharacterized protein MONBRDRAFT_6032 [Monosiga brevicollis MX1]|uniref:Uncharacterized protein n=1 Tax=Monosiga brevicollis TaxID=81824 RepID=A9URD4_MONBE|nr:uncharacterized protein MONBRDRAFT_6032 [Monosiga brevicollis MX1]EDQ92225.1 predicted protein [Monosiga brevicollis MX1]|eukprot:XP_001743511.1 hypothetical protein [Monosiga brevicollis MX1]
MASVPPLVPAQLRPTRRRKGRATTLPNLESSDMDATSTSAISHRPKVPVVVRASPASRRGSEPAPKRRLADRITSSPARLASGALSVPGAEPEIKPTEPRRVLQTRARSCDHASTVSAEAWEEWLTQAPASTTAVWLILPRVQARAARRTGPEADPTRPSWVSLTETGLRWGWIRGHLKPSGAPNYEVCALFTRISPKTRWSFGNQQILEQLLDANQVVPAVAQALAPTLSSPQWEELHAVGRGEAPPDLLVALQPSASAKRNWEAFPLRVRRNMLQWVHDARDLHIRAQRIAEIAAQAEINLQAR